MLGEGGATSRSAIGLGPMSSGCAYVWRHTDVFLKTFVPVTGKSHVLVTRPTTPHLCLPLALRLSLCSPRTSQRLEFTNQLQAIHLLLFAFHSYVPNRCSRDEAPTIYLIAIDLNPQRATASFAHNNKPLSRLALDSEGASYELTTIHHNPSY